MLRRGFAGMGLAADLMFGFPLRDGNGSFHVSGVLLVLGLFSAMMVCYPVVTALRVA